MSYNNSDIYEFISKKIKELRANYKGVGIKQEELAQKIGALPNTISRWETCTYKPKITDLQRLATFFGVSIGEFFPENEIKSDQKLVALTRVSGDLPDEDLEELIEYAKYRRARRLIEKNEKPSSRTKQ